MTVVLAAQMISDFFFPSELHDTLPFAHFNSCLPKHLRESGGAGEVRERGEGQGTGASDQKGGEGVGAQEGVAAALYDAFLEHRRLAREAVRDSIDVYDPDPSPLPSPLAICTLIDSRIRVFDMHLHACAHAHACM